MYFHSQAILHSVLKALTTLSFRVIYAQRVLWPDYDIAILWPDYDIAILWP